MAAPKEVIADDERESVSLLLKLRLPWLLVGLVVGGFLTLFIARFEGLLNQRIALAFFIPFIVYLSDAVGTQTEAIYVRNLARGRLNFLVYLVKEFSVGLILGLIFGLILGLFTMAMFQSLDVALTVAAAMAISVAIAPVVALTIAQTLKRIHQDPAVGAGPFATIVQDFIAVIVYFAVATLVIFR